MNRVEACLRRMVVAVVLAGLAPAAVATPPVLDDFDDVLPRLQPERRAGLQRHAERWAGWTESERAAFEQRAAEWDALPAAERGALRERYRAASALPARDRDRVRTAARWLEALPPDRQQALRDEFQALDASVRRGWLLGPDLGADYTALQPLLAQVPVAEHDEILRVLRGMTARQRKDLAVLVQRTPPQERAQLRRELVSTAAARRDDWLWDRLHR